MIYRYNNGDFIEINDGKITLSCENSILEFKDLNELYSFIKEEAFNLTEIDYKLSNLKFKSNKTKLFTLDCWDYECIEDTLIIIARNEEEAKLLVDKSLIINYADVSTSTLEEIDLNNNENYEIYGEYVGKEIGVYLFIDMNVSKNSEFIEIHLPNKKLNKRDLVVHSMPTYSTECIDEYLHGNYDNLILTTDNYYYITDKNDNYNWYKVYVKISKIDKFDSKIYNEYPAIYQYTYKMKNQKEFSLSCNESITFTEFKNEEYSTLWYIICRTLEEDLDDFYGEQIDLDFKASYHFNAKSTSDIGFDGSWGYWEGGDPKMHKFYINGIRIIKQKNINRTCNFNAPKEIIFPEKYYEIV